ncbi:MAG: hypothetical protein IKW10_08325 [Oscillospiraceae bacterium]|nr:hypothetical protein [Oscillospiraceae bacterium]
MKKKLFPIILSIVGIILGICLIVHGANVKGISHFEDFKSVSSVGWGGPEEFGADFYTIINEHTYHTQENTYAIFKVQEESNDYFKSFFSSFAGYLLMALGAVLVLHYLKAIYEDLLWVSNEKKQQNLLADTTESVLPTEVCESMECEQ